MNNKFPRICLTPGEPAGVGPDIVIAIAQHAWDAELVVIANDALLKDRARALKLPLELVPFDETLPTEKHQPGRLKIQSVPMNHPVKTGELTIQNAAYVMQTLDIAARFCQEKITDGVVTGPVHKGILNEAGIAFTGHTEFFAEKSGTPLSLMLFVTPDTKVALTTTHLALKDVPGALTSDKIKKVLRLLQSELQKKFKILHPKMLVCGLNPHAGEQGHLGREEIDIISPALDELKKEKINVEGPLSADTVFTHHRLKEADAVLAMYHDQALPVVKYMSFGRAVNVTLGLPYIRTSVDHGVALDVAGTGRLDAGSFREALLLAIKLL